MKYALIAAGLLAAAYIIWRRWSYASTGGFQDVGSPTQFPMGPQISPPTTTMNLEPTRTAYSPPVPSLADLIPGVRGYDPGPLSPSTGYSPPARGPQVGSPVPTDAPPALAPPGEPQVTRQESTPLTTMGGWTVKPPTIIQNTAPVTLVQPAGAPPTLVPPSTGPKFQARSGRGAF